MKSEEMFRVIGSLAIGLVLAFMDILVNDYALREGIIESSSRTLFGFYSLVFFGFS